MTRLWVRRCVRYAGRYSDGTIKWYVCGKSSDRWRSPGSPGSFFNAALIRSSNPNVVNQLEWILIHSGAVWVKGATTRIIVAPAGPTATVRLDLWLLLLPVFCCCKTDPTAEKGSRLHTACVAFASALLWVHVQQALGEMNHVNTEEDGRSRSHSSSLLLLLLLLLLALYLYCLCVFAVTQKSQCAAAAAALGNTNRTAVA